MVEKKYISEIKDLMQEWDYEANEDLDSTRLTIGSNKKAWWKCYLCGHKWQTSISHRTREGRNSCPNCHYGHWSKGRKNLTQTNPDIVKDWDYTKNGKLTPDMFTENSRFEVWFKCHICGKELKTNIKNYSGCNVCKKNKKLSENNLLLKYPEIVKEWHTTKNGKLMPNNVSPASSKKVWWKCKKCGYEWEAKISNRTYLNRGCPFCSGSVLIPGKNDLATTHPEIAKEWHPTKNKLKPNEVRYGTNKKVWWICPHGHEYQATINHRTSVNGTQCPICNSGRQTSFAEQAFYYYIKKIRPDAISRYKADFLGKLELDIFIPSINVAIEYDGFAWHKENKRQREQKKYEICKANNIFLIRLRETKEDYYFDIADECICVPDLYKHKNLDRFIPKVLNMVDNSLKKFYSGETVHLFPTYDVDIEKDRIKILKSYATECIKDSFGALYPEIAKEWHPIKNEGITPYMFKPNSGHKVWWICPKCKNEYQSTIGHRIGKNPTGCPKCGIEKSTQAKRKSINMIDPKTNQVIETFISISDASRKMKISIGNISAVCQGLRNKASGYIWQYADEQEIKKHQKKKKQLEFEL